MKLHGPRILDPSVLLPVLHLTMSLAGHGAEVIKVEPPGEGDPVRHADEPARPSWRAPDPGEHERGVLAGSEPASAA